MGFQYRRFGLAVGLLAALPGAHASAQELNLKMGASTTPLQVRSLVAEDFVERVAELSDNQIQIEYFHSGQLGSPREIFEGLQLGTVDFAYMSTGDIGTLIPKFGIAYLPFRWDSEEHLVRFTQSDMWNDWKQELLDTNGIRILTSFPVNPRQLLTVPGPIDTPADLKGVKVRLPEVAGPIAIWSALGASPVPVAFTEAYQALQQGTVEGVEGDQLAMVGSSWHEVAKHLTLTAHTIDALSLVVSELTWNRLSDAQKDAVMTAVSEVPGTFTSLTEDQINEAIERMKAAGVEVHEPDRAAFVELAAPAVKEFSLELSPEADATIESLR